MLPEILISGLLMGGPMGLSGNEEALRAVQKLYQYSTQSVQVEPNEMQRLLTEVESRMESPSAEAGSAFEQLAAEVRKDQPDGREIRIYARQLYRALEPDAA
jgi:transcription termination factor NusB